MRKHFDFSFLSSKSFTQKCNLFIFYVLIFLSTDALARAGGAGGGSGDSDSDGGAILILLYYIVELIMLLPFPWNIIVLIGVIVAFYFWAKNQKQSSTLNSLSQLNTNTASENSIAPIVAGIPDFSQSEFYNKVETAFYKIQDAWGKQDLKQVRQFISDGVYQRFEAQFIMMKELEQRNELSDIRIIEKRIVSAENDGQFHILNVRVSASMTDYFKSKKFSQLNSGGSESFSEYWTFVKKVSAQNGKDIYNSHQCPNCGNSIENKLGEISKCDSCGTQINNGDYDWVLSEITQPEEFASSYNQIGKRKQFYERLNNKGYSSPEFSPQYIEDKASNAYLQIKIAEAFADPKRINRFCTEEFTEKAKTSFTTKYLFNRLFLSDVSLVNIYEDDKNIIAALSISSTQQKVTVNGNKLNILHPSPVSIGDFLILSRSKKFTVNKFSAMAHNCSGCGAPVEDSLQLTCNYCGTSLNDNTKDWIVEKLLTQSEYAQFKNGFNESVNSNRQENKLEDDNWDVRDYALNNMMVMAMADGILQDEERELLVKTSKSLGYNTKKITELFDEVKSGSLALKLPEDTKKRTKVIRLMTKVAQADNNLHENEKAILEQAEKMV